jgi:hypothetical protein
MKRLIPIMLCAGAALAAEAKDFHVTLAPGKIHEECQRVEAGQSRQYSWKSDQPVDFNVHYHRGNDVSFPVKRDAMRGDGGTFTAKDGEDYCWMWTARDKAVKLEGRIEK